MTYILIFTILIMFAYIKIQDAMISAQKDTINTLTNALSEVNQDLELSRVEVACNNITIAFKDRIISAYGQAIDEHVELIEGIEIQAWAKKIQEGKI